MGECRRCNGPARTADNKGFIHACCLALAQADRPTPGVEESPE